MRSRFSTNGHRWSQRFGARYAIATAALLAAAIAIYSGRVSGRREAFSARAALKETRDAARKRPIYPYSVVAGGVYSAEELKAAAALDTVVAAHYAGFGSSLVRGMSLGSDRRAYVSFRIGDGVFWTRRPVSLRRGEHVLSDGETLVRARCGNRISDVPRTPVSSQEPPEGVMDEADRGLKEHPATPVPESLLLARNLALLELQPSPITGQPALRLPPLPAGVGSAGGRMGVPLGSGVLPGGALPPPIPAPVPGVEAVPPPVPPVSPPIPPGGPVPPPDTPASPPGPAVSPTRPLATPVSPPAPADSPKTPPVPVAPPPSTDNPKPPVTPGSPPVLPDDPILPPVTPDSPPVSTDYPFLPLATSDSPPPTAPVPVPEPGSLVLVVSSLLIIGLVPRKRRRGPIPMQIDAANLNVSQSSARASFRTGSIRACMSSTRIST